MVGAVVGTVVGERRGRLGWHRPGSGTGMFAGDGHPDETGDARGEEHRHPGQAADEDLRGGASCRRERGVAAAHSVGKKRHSDRHASVSKGRMGRMGRMGAYGANLKMG